VFANHKYASNVIEKCLVYGDADHRNLVLDRILCWPECRGQNSQVLLMMMKDM